MWQSSTFAELGQIALEDNFSKDWGRARGWGEEWFLDNSIALHLLPHFISNLMLQLI